MSPDGAHVSSSRSEWRSIRPWAPLLSLSVREITSVSVTFTLSSGLSEGNNDLEPFASLGLAAAQEEGGIDNADGEDDSCVPESKKRSIISDTLTGRLSVEVNGLNWQRFLFRIDEVVDEAVIIVYALTPGREYDIKLSIAKGEFNGSIHQQVRTEETEPIEAPTEPESPDAERSTSSDPPTSTPSTSLPNTPPLATIPLTIEDRLAQLQHTLNIVNAERETLSATLKASRRDAQKADAALRSEIDTLKRASERHVAAEHRAKQKLLSLREAVKRAQIATQETEEVVREVEELIPELNKQREAKESEYTKIKEQADRVQKERDRQAEKEKKRIETMRIELAGLTNKMDKLNVKREKLEAGTIGDLEEQLRNIEQEIQAEKDGLNHTFLPAFDQRAELSAEDTDYHRPDQSALVFPYLSVQRPRVQFTPIQRPSPSDSIHSYSATPWNNLSRQRHASLTHTSRASIPPYQQTPILLTNPNRHPAHNNLSTSSSIPISPPVPHANTSPNAISAASVSTSLSSRAPAFEPGRLLKAGTTTSSGFPGPSPIQRPRLSGSRGSSKSKSNSQQMSWAGIH